jgi:hypothetical protein
MNPYQMVLHRPVETTGVLSNYEFRGMPSARMMLLTPSPG